MDRQLKEQVLSVSEMANHKGWDVIKNYALSQQNFILSQCFVSDKRWEDKIQGLGEIAGIRKILQYVEAMVAQRKDIQP